jgi:hypothetical protein
VVERFFAELEGITAPILRSLDRERRGPNEDELDLLLQFMAFQFVRVPSFRPLALGVLDRLSREELGERLRTPETWRGALIEAEMDPAAPGADYEGMKRFFESGEYNLTAETDWYLQRAFGGVGVIVDGLRQHYWGSAFTEHGRLIATDNPVVLDGERGRMTGFANAEFVFYPISRHVLLAGTLERVPPPPMNLNFFASMNTMMLLRVDAQAYSHIPDFVWLDENRRTQCDYRLFSRERILDSVL